MENQSNDNTNKTSATVICRKCGGPHFTIKCGKEKTAEKPVEIKEPLEKTFKDDNNKPKDKYNSFKSDRQRFRKTFRVKLSDLPTDVSEEEMLELTYDWGHVVKVRVLNYNESSTAYIDFGFEKEAEYFVKAIDKTPFDYIIISAQRVDSVRPDKKNDCE